MLGQPWWYWCLFIGAAILIGAVPIAHKWERRQDERDAQLWAHLHSDIYSRRVD